MYRVFVVLKVWSQNRGACLIVCAGAVCERFCWGCNPRSERFHACGPLTPLEALYPFQPVVHVDALYPSTPVEQDLQPLGESGCYPGSCFMFGGYRLTLGYIGVVKWLSNVVT